MGIWIDSKSIVEDNETALEEHENYYELRTSFVRPAARTWLAKGASWPGGVTGHSHPTLVRHLWRDAPPRRPAGLELCNSGARERWKDDWWGFPPYQYKEDNLVMDAKGKSRLSSIIERERLMHFPASNRPIDEPPMVFPSSITTQPR